MPGASKDTLLSGVWIFVSVKASVLCQAGEKGVALLEGIMELASGARWGLRARHAEGQ